jgi:outer membrane protein assembly factor BamB
MRRRLHITCSAVVMAALAAGGTSAAAAGTNAAGTNAAGTRAAAFAEGGAHAAASTDWPAYLGGVPHHSDNVAATAITPANAGSLTRAWRWTPAGPTMSGQPGPNLFSSPTVAGGTIYIGANTGVFYALDQGTGHVLWQRFLGFVTKKTCGRRGFISTATVAPDPVSHALTVYVAAADGYLYALDAATGAVVWRSVVALPSATVNDFYNWGSPAVVGGRVYMGVSSQCDDPLVMGGLKVYDQATGALRAFYRTNPGGSKGPSIWSSPAARTSGKALFVTTGNGTKGSDQDSVVRLDPATLAKVASWEVPASQRLSDSDFGASPTLFTTTVGGTATPLVGACNKNGIYYVLRQDNLAAGPVWERAVGTPDTTGISCLAAAVWDGSHLFVASNQTKIGGTGFGGSIRSLNPATGAIRWQRGLGAPVLGSPSADGGGVLAVPTYGSAGLYLVNAATGGLLNHITATRQEFGQPVFAGTMLLVPTVNNGLWAYRPGAR